MHLHHEMVGVDVKLNYNSINNSSAITHCAGKDRTDSTSLQPLSFVYVHMFLIIRHQGRTYLLSVPVLRYHTKLINHFKRNAE